MAAASPKKSLIKTHFHAMNLKATHPQLHLPMAGFAMFVLSVNLAERQTLKICTYWEILRNISPAGNIAKLRHHNIEAIVTKNRCVNIVIESKRPQKAMKSC